MQVESDKKPNTPIVKKRYKLKVWFLRHGPKLVPLNMVSVES